MSAKKGRRTKVPPVPPEKSQHAPPQEPMDSPNLSVIDKASFLEGLQVNYGNPLHSTAMEEDFNTLEEEQMDKGKAGGKAVPETTKTTAKQRGAAVKRKEMDKENEKKKKRRSAGEKVKARPAGEERKKKKGEPEGENEESDAPKAKRLVGKKPAKRRSAGKTSAPSPVKNQRMKKDTKRKSESGGGKLSDPESWDSDTDGAQQNYRRVLSSDEEVGDDTSWAPSPKKARVYSFDRTRKSTSDSSKSRKSSSGSAAEKVNTNKQRRERRGHQGGTDLEVVLDAFLDFCDQYKESVESKAVKQSIECFSSSVKAQLLEKISSNKELRLLRRENAKVSSLIRTKTRRLLDAKHELMRAERQVWLLQKEKAQLKLRLSDLRRSCAFLHDLRQLNQQYLEHRHTHRKEKETYGRSSLPALLLQTKHVQTAENQLRSINKEMEKRMKKSGTCK